MAIGNLALKAWKNREEGTGRVFYPPPRFISQLRLQRNIPEPQPPVPAQQSYTAVDNTKIVQQNNLLEIPVTEFGGSGYSFDMTMPEVTPVDWEYWQTLMDGDLPAYNGNDFMSGSQMETW